MSKSLRSMSKTEQFRAVTRRLRENRGGLGFLAALDAMSKIGVDVPLPVDPDPEEWGKEDED